MLLFVFRPQALTDGQQQRYIGWLGPDETERWLRYRFDEHRQEYLCGRALTRWVLGHYLGCSEASLQFGANAYGKPQLRDSGLHFNLSHSGGVNVLAVSRRGPLGVDVERADGRRVCDNVARHHFAPLERAWLDALPPEQRLRGFFSIWTLKESFIKAVGQGLSFPLSAFAFQMSGKALVLHQTNPTSEAWHSALLDLGSDLLCSWTQATGDVGAGCDVFEATPGVSIAPQVLTLLSRGGTVGY